MSAKRTLAIGTALAAGLGPIAYPLFIRRWCLTWGASSPWVPAGRSCG